MIFDTHAHYDDEAFEADRDLTLTGQYAGGVGRIVNCGANLATSRNSVELARKYNFIYAAVGVHPDDAGELDEEGFRQLRELLHEDKVVAVGEIGLDYHWDKWPREVQRAMFVKQWELADEAGLPVVIHSRDAAADTMDIVREMYLRAGEQGRVLKADMHCYSYSAQQADEYLRMGLYFGVGGVVTFKNARKTAEVVSMLPLERILLETDCPYLAPEPFRGRRNRSEYIAYAAEAIARIKGITADEVQEVTYANACRFFGLE